MKKRIASLLLTLVMVLGLFPTTALAAGSTLTGSGTADDPYQIKTAADLSAVKNDLSAHYLLLADIAPASWTANLDAFTGTLDGNGYTITLPSGAKAGLFQSVTGTVRNLRLVATDVKPVATTFGMLAVTVSGNIENCSVIAAVAFSGSLPMTPVPVTICTGGIAGIVSGDATVKNCYAAVAFTSTVTSANGSTLNFGAVVGQIIGGTITNCFYNSELTGVDKAISNDTASQSSNCTAKTTEDFKTLSATLNENISGSEDLLSWKDTDTYPEFASHKAALEELTGTVTLTGTVQAGQTLTATDDFTATGARTYTWYQVAANGDETELNDVTGKTYTLQNTDIGCKIKVVVAVEGTTGTKFAITETAVTADPDTMGAVSFTVTPSAAKIYVADAHGNVSGPATSFDLIKGNTYTWFTGLDGYTPKSGTFTVSENQTIDVTLTQRTVNGYEFNTVADAEPGDLTTMTKFPTSPETALVKWATNCGKYGTEISNGEVTNPVYLNGYLYIVGGETKGTLTLFKIDPATGNKEEKVQLTENNGSGYYYFLAAGDGQIYVRLNGRVEAYDTSLKQLWSTQDSRVLANYGGPVYYSDGLVFVSSAASGKTTGGMLCLSAATGDVLWYNQAELTSAETGSYNGHYWAGPCAVGDYVVYGSDGGRVYSVNKYTGQIVDRLDVGKDIYADNEANWYKKSFIRSSVIHDGGKIYFTSTDGYIHMADFNAETGKITEHKYALIGESAGTGGNASAFMDNKGSSTTPAICNGRLYAMSYTGLAVFNATALEKYYQTTTDTQPRGNLLNVMADSDGTCYIFTTYYRGSGTSSDGTKLSGSIVMFTDEPGQTEPSTAMNFGTLTKNYTQFGCAFPIFGADGTIYFTNDLGTLVAIQTMPTYLTDFTSDVGELKQTFTGNETTYEMAVPADTSSVKLTLTANEGSTLTVKVGETPIQPDQQADRAASSLTYTIPLTNGAAAVTIETTKGSDTLSYSLSIRKAATNTGIHAVTSTSNNISSSTSVVSQVTGFDNLYAVAEASTATRLWLGLADSNATMSKPEVSIGTMGVYSVTASNVYQNVTYGYRFYSSSPTYPLLAETTVTAEDKTTTKTYYAAMFAGKDLVAHDANSDGSFDPETDYILAKETTQGSMIFSSLTDTKTVTADCVGKAPAFTYSTSDDAVATVDSDGKVTMKKSGDAVISVILDDTTVKEWKISFNAAPTLKDGVTAVTTASVTVNTAYELDLTNIFTDSDSTLTYTVSVDGKNATTTEASYTYTPTAAGTYTLVFTASDGVSIATYTVTLTVTENTGTGGNGGSGGGTEAAKTITVYVSISDDTGSFVTGKKNTVMWNVPVDVEDLDGDGKYTYLEAMTAAHKKYYPGGEDGFEGNSNSGWINTIWGTNGANFGLVVNNKWCNGGNTTLKKNNHIAAFGYQDISADYSDLYTYFDSTSYSAKTGTEKTFTVKGLNIMMSGETSNAYGTPEGATVTAYDADGLSVLTTETDENGKFTLTFSDPGTYIVEVSGTCAYTATGTYGTSSFDDAPVAPARCEVTVSGTSTGDDAVSTTKEDKELAKETYDLITAIGTVTKNSGEKIEAARAAYDKLTATQKKLVSNYDALVAAEKAYAELTGKLPFTDVTESDYYYNAVRWAWEKGITNGSTGTTFTPGTGCTRSQMVTFLWRAAGSPAPKGTTLPFTDVDKDSHYYQALIWAIENGITNGVTNTIFDPNATCTRGQMAAFLYRSAKSPAVTGENTFADVTKDAYYCDAVTWAAEKGITQGTADGGFDPSATCTRGQMVTFLYRYQGE